MYTEPDAEIFRLRTALRDLVSVSTIRWPGWEEPSEIAGGVADVLIDRWASISSLSASAIPRPVPR